MDYNNPGAMLPNNGWSAQSALGGFLGGLGVGNYQDMQERAVRDSDLGFMEKLHNYEMAKAEDPARLGEFDVRANQAGVQNQLYKTDLPFGTAVSGMQAQQSKNQAQMSGDQLQTFYNRASALSALSDELKTNPINPGVPQSQDDIKRWNNIKDQYSKAGLNNLPDYPDQGDIDTIHQRAQAVVNTPQYKQALGKISAETQGKLKEIGLTQKGETERAIAVANIHANIPSMDRVAAQSMARIVDGTATENDKDAINTYYGAKVMPYIMNGVDAQLQAIRDSKLPPEEKAKRIKELMDRYNPASRMTSSPSGGGGQPQPQRQAPSAPPAVDKSKVDTVVNSNPNVPRARIIEDMKAKGFISPNYNE